MKIPRPSDIFLRWYSFRKKTCANLPKKELPFSQQFCVFFLITVTAAVEKQIQQNIRSAATHASAVIKTAAHIGLLHLLIRETGGFQLLHQFLIFIVVRLHLRRSPCVLECSCIVSGTGVCNGRNIIPLCISVADAVQYPDSLCESAVPDEIHSRLQMYAVLIAVSSGRALPVESAVSAVGFVLALIHEAGICSDRRCTPAMP